MAFYGLTFNGTPFLLDTSKVVRLRLEGDEVTSDKQNLSPKKFQPLEELLEEIDRIFPFQYLKDFSAPPIYQGRDLGALSLPWLETGAPGPEVRVGDWYYPNNASRFSVFRGLASSSQAKAMLAGVPNGTSSTFLMMNNPAGPVAQNPAAFTLSTQMFMLPPRCIGEHAGGMDGIYLITLVDERYYWRTTPATLRLDQNTTWDDLIEQVIQNLLPENLPLDLSYSPISPAYGQPEPDSHLWASGGPASALLDVIAANVGRVVVRNLDGSYALLTHEESAATALLNRGNVQAVARTAGGDLFSRLPTLKIGDLFQAKNSVVPTNIHVTFPYYVEGDSPVPHFLNSRYKNQRPTSWYEEAYGEVCTLTIPITSGGPNVSGLLGTSDDTIRTTAKALIPDEETIFPTNLSGLTALAMQLAKDQYDQTALVALDETYPGSVNWSPEGIHDILWRWSARAKGATTRVMKTDWSASLKETQHACSPLSGATIIPKGVGGPSVNQTVRDSFSGSVTTSLCKEMASGDLFGNFRGVDHFPTQYRWRGRIEGETILFEGTSGGLSSGVLCDDGVTDAFRVDVVYRGIDNTLPAYHPSASTVLQVVPNTTYGVNLVTYGPGEFVYPYEQTSGGISAVLKVPQTQTVKVLSSSGLGDGGQTFFRAIVQTYEKGNYEDKEPVWAVERNAGGVFERRYDGQFVEFGGGGTGEEVKPVYLIEEPNTEGTGPDCDPLYFEELDVRCEAGVLNLYKRKIKVTLEDGCWEKKVFDWNLLRAEGCCSCGSAGSGSGPGSGPGGCVAGTCSVCTDAPYQWVIVVDGFSGICDVFNRKWTLTYVSSCTWSSSAQGLGTASVLLTIDSGNTVLVTFTYGAGGTTYTSTFNGVISGADCCTTILLSLVSCGCSNQIGGGGGPPVSCDILCDKTPLTWQVEGRGFAGCFSSFNGDFTVSYVGSCVWQGTAGGVTVEVVMVGPGDGLYNVNLSFYAADGSRVFYFAQHTVQDCCDPITFTRIIFRECISGTGFAPPSVEMTPSCADDPPPSGDNCPATLSATPYCCSVDSGGGGGTITTACCTSLMPATLYATVSYSSSGCACMSGTAVLTWDGSKWTGEYTSACLGSQGVILSLLCVGTTISGFQAQGNCNGTSITFATLNQPSWSCGAAPYFAFAATLTDPPGCCTGSIVLEITA